MRRVLVALILGGLLMMGFGCALLALSVVASAQARVTFVERDTLERIIDHDPARALDVLEDIVTQEQADAFSAALLPRTRDIDEELRSLEDARRRLILSGKDPTTDPVILAIDVRLPVVRDELANTRGAELEPVR